MIKKIKFGLIAILNVFVLISCTSSDSKLTKEDIAVVTQENQMVYTWALNAILNYKNDASDFIFSGEEKFERNEKPYRDALKKWWDISNKSQLTQSLVALESGAMHQQMFLDEYEGFYDLTEEDFQQALEEFPDASGLNQLIWEQKETLKDKGILAWDLVRAIGVLGWGYQANYITKEEAYDHCLVISKSIQNNFSSYEEMAQSYLIGYFYWSREKKEYEEMKKIADDILDDSDSAWNLFPFKYDMTKKSE